eukprot:scpid111524/ scgid26477/ 
MHSVWCKPGVHWWSIHMASSVVWIRQLSVANLDLFHSDLIIVAMRENLWVNIQCIGRLACFPCNGCMHGTWYTVCACVRTRMCMCAPARICTDMYAAVCSICSCCVDLRSKSN